MASQKLRQLDKRLAGEWTRLAKALGPLHPGVQIPSNYPGLFGFWHMGPGNLEHLRIALVRIERPDLVDEIDSLTENDWREPDRPSAELRVDYRDDSHAIEGMSEASLLIDPGTASAENIAEFLTEFSKLYRMMGGSGVQFTKAESRCAEGEIA